MAKKKPAAASVPVDAIKHISDKRPNIPTGETAALRRRRRDIGRRHALPARPLARPAARLEGQGRAGRRAARSARRADLHPGEDPPAGDRRGPARRRPPQASPSLNSTCSPTSTASTTSPRSCEFYQHDQHWTNRLILGDSLLVMTSLAEKERLRARSRGSTSTRPTASSSAATGRSAPASAT